MKIFTALICLVLPIITFAQQTNIKSHIKILKDSQGHALISGFAKNNSDQEQILSYSLQLNKHSPTGNSINTQSGSFLLLPGESKQLAQLKIDVFSIAKFDIKLKINNEHRTISKDIVSSEENFYFYFSTIEPFESMPSEFYYVPAASNEAIDLNY